MAERTTEHIAEHTTAERTAEHIAEHTTAERTAERTGEHTSEAIRALVAHAALTSSRCQ